MRIARSPYLLAALLAAPCTASHAAEAFASPGARATLSVDYVYESAGKRRSEGAYDPYEWRVRRTVSLAADLAAQSPTALPTVQPMDAAQMAALEGKGSKAQAAAAGVPPAVADVQQAIARCAGNEACMQREMMKLGSSMQGAPKSDMAAYAQGAPRHQAWRPTAQKGTYAIDETVHISVTDPICTSKPRHRCTRDETRKGAGVVPLPPPEAGRKPDKGAAAGISAVEVDFAKGTLTVALPVPMYVLPYTETITTDEPEGTHDTPTPRGPQARQHRFRVNAAGAVSHDKPFTVPLKGGWRSQSGEQVAKLKGEFGDAGTLTVRWRFAVQ